MSFNFVLDPAQEAATDLIVRVGRRLQEALLKRKRDDKVTQQSLAIKLDVDRSRINRCFSGYNNLTLATLAELAWALDAQVDISITLEELDPGQNHYVASQLSTETGVTVTASTENIAHRQSTMASGATTGNRKELVYAG